MLVYNVNIFDICMMYLVVLIDIVGGFIVDVVWFVWYYGFVYDIFKLMQYYVVIVYGELIVCIGGCDGLVVVSFLLFDFVNSFMWMIFKGMLFKGMGDSDFCMLFIELFDDFFYVVEMMQLIEC